MPHWINKRAKDTRVYDWELVLKIPESLGKVYKCKKTGRMITSEALPKNEGSKVFVLIADEWKEDKTKEILEYIENCKVVKDIIE
jgi:hypothetical protein